MTSHKNEQYLTLRRPKDLGSVSYADADYAKCEETRRSVSGSVNTVGGTIATWWSRKQNSVTLSSAEAELHSYALCCQESMFVRSILMEFFDGMPALTAVIMEDNQGCIFLIKNQSVGQRTKHVDVRILFTREQFQRHRVMPLYCRTDVQWLYKESTGRGLWNPFESITGRATDLRCGLSGNGGSSRQLQ